ncbi:MAG TPA: iron chelate uptake ABC transporter family permease subunit, partial [Devosia sp.]
SRHRVLLPVSMLLGATVMIWSDTVARSLFAPREMPVGIITALIGAPIFVLVLVRYRRVT